MKKLIKNILAGFFNLIFPPECVGCGQKNTYLCNTCLKHVRRPERTCPNWIYPLFDYRDPVVKKVVWALKYKNRKNLAIIIAELLRAKIEEELADLEILENFREPIVIPIPLAKSRLRERGYNQSELIAKELTSFVVATKVLIKVKDTPHQARIENRQTRMQNVVGSFGVKNKDLIKDRNIILIDDVATTGATLAEAKKVLKNSGAKKIIAFTFAH